MLQELILTPASVVVLAALAAWAVWAVRRMLGRGLCDCGDACGDGCRGCPKKGCDGKSCPAAEAMVANVTRG